MPSCRVHIVFAQAESQAPASILASLSLALLALEDVAAPSRNLAATKARASMQALSEGISSPLPTELPQGLKEGLYGVALASTLSAGRREIAEVVKERGEKDCACFRATARQRKNTREVVCVRGKAKAG